VRTNALSHNHPQSCINVSHQCIKLSKPKICLFSSKPQVPAPLIFDSLKKSVGKGPVPCMEQPSFGRRHTNRINEHDCLSQPVLFFQSSLRDWSVWVVAFGPRIYYQIKLQTLNALRVHLDIQRRCSHHVALSPAPLPLPWSTSMKRRKQHANILRISQGRPLSVICPCLPDRQVYPYRR
jgi:hypothetical protein